MKLYFYSILIFALSSCSVEPEGIDYGKEACVYCKMNIVDQQHAAELVTKKGKVYKYDAIECMINDTENNNSEKVKLFLVMDYNRPNTFLDAQKASFLISENVPSPMGANLSAFESLRLAEEMKAKKQGEVFDWIRLNQTFKNK